MAKGPKVAKLAWRHPVGGAIQGQVVADYDEQRLFVASLNGLLTALDRRGNEVFVVELGGRAYGAPCVDRDGTIFVGSDARKFFAISAQGVVLWTLDTLGEADTGPVIDQLGRVLFAAGRSLFAVRPRGDVVFRFEAGGKIFSSPAVKTDGSIVFGAQDHFAYRISQDGQLLGKADLGFDCDGSPAITDDGDTCFGTDGGEIVCLDEDWRVRTRISVGGYVRGPLSIARNGDVFAGVYGPNPRQVRVNLNSSMVRGSHYVRGTSAREFGVHGGATEDDIGSLYFGAQDDAIYGIDTNGNISFYYQTDGDVDAPITILSDGSLVAGSDDGYVYSFEP
jgi:outer membrane protein assembly factor BamB